MYKKYKLLVDRNSELLSKEVTSHLKKGYKPYGDPFATERAWFQAVVLPVEIVVDEETKESCGGNCSCKKG